MISKSMRSSQKTANVAKAFNRRSVLKGTAAIAGAAIACPFVIHDAFAKSTINAIVWTNYLTDDFLKKFEKDTKIKVNVTSLDSNEELLNKMKASRGRGFDLITPTLNRKGQWIDLELLQPWETNKIKNIANVKPAFVQASEAWTWDGGQYHLPHIWGTEAMSWRTDLWSTEYGKLSLGDLWIPEMKGKVQGRPHSMMAGIGRYLEGTGKLPPFVNAYKDEDNMRKIWDEITKFAVEHKPWIKQFWNDHDTQKTGFMQNGIILGQTWDGPAIELFKDDKPVQYMAPKEGAFAWLDGLSMPIGAENKDETYELINAIYTIDAAADSAIKTGYNGTVKGYADKLDAKSKDAFNRAYPGDALANLWWWPDEPAWYASIRTEYRDKFIAA
jgi:spermidine/putrescine transport system substrate-binding protein|tara:strand:- start:31 stop:1188 length:1158 start_codon:yes stop_codon:yes gene_type:complete